MTTSLQKRSKGTKRAQLAVSGYIRELSLSPFPNELIDLIFDFFNPTDEWDPNCMGKNMIFNKKKFNDKKTTLS